MSRHLNMSIFPSEIYISCHVFFPGHPQRNHPRYVGKCSNMKTAIEKFNIEMSSFKTDVGKLKCAFALVQFTFRNYIFNQFSLCTTIIIIIALRCSGFTFPSFSSKGKRRSEHGDVDDTVSLQTPAGDKKSRSCRDVFLGNNYNASNISETVHVLQSRSVLLRCNVLLGNLSRRWIYEGDVIYLDKNALSTQLGNTVELLNNYSLLINPVMLFHDGWYECAHGTVVLNKYKVTVEVQPHVFISIDGNNITDIVVFDKQKTFTAVCHAQRSKPAVKMTWTINNKLLNSSQSFFDCWILENGSTYDCTSTLETRIQEDSGTITCIASAQDSFGKITSTVPFQTYLIPDVSVTINNNTPNAVFCIEEIVTAECLAIGSRPKVNFTWVVNDQLTEPSHVECKITEDGNYSKTFNCVSTLNINITEEGDGTVICIAGAHGDFQQNFSVSFRTSCFHSKDSPRIQTNSFQHRDWRNTVPMNTVPMQIIPAEIKYRSCPLLSENDHDTYVEATNRISVIDVDSIIIADSIPGNGVFGCWFAINTYDDSVMVTKSLKGLNKCVIYDEVIYLLNCVSA
ncbi:hypothetical protein HOLleu_32834 [Holothuria leucospilota]|uniref:Ig-like domain-containing protein n=1 Tax=Holothuria leucospilota TaxID=206669 RepID=A0A9Q1BJH3_HOLLE|nr:hypothetical protein HOLleu_32834 [Holothuria leucospilota]